SRSTLMATATRLLPGHSGVWSAMSSPPKVVGLSAQAPHSPPLGNPQARDRSMPRERSALPGRGTKWVMLSHRLQEDVPLAPERQLDHALGCQVGRCEHQLLVGDG